MTIRCLPAAAFALLIAVSAAPAFAQSDRGLNAGGPNTSNTSSAATTTTTTTPTRGRTIARTSRTHRTATTNHGTVNPTPSGAGTANAGVPNQYVGQSNQGGAVTTGQSTGTGTTTTSRNTSSGTVGAPNQFNGQAGPAAALPAQSGVK